MLKKPIWAPRFFHRLLLLTVLFSLCMQISALAASSSSFAVLGTTQANLTIYNPESGERMARVAETNLGDFCTDAYRAVLGADIAIVNSGAFRTTIHAGEITRQQLERLHPFGDTILLTRVSGQMILDALEHGARLYPEENAGFLQVSGLSYAIDPTVPSSVVTDETGAFLAVSGEYRVKNVTVAGVPLDLSKMYTLASSNFLLYGGDGYSMFAECPVLASMGDVDVLVHYLSNHLDGRVGASYSSPWGQGRISLYEMWDGAAVREPTRMRTIDGISYYEIGCGAELAFLAESGGHWLNENYILTSDIYLNETLPQWDSSGNCVNADELNLWQPIGTEDTPFTGTLLGNGFCIIGLYAAGTELEAQGLFGAIEGGTIDGLSIRSSYVSNELDYSYAGTVAGCISSSRTRQAVIQNCRLETCCVKGCRAGGYSAVIGGVYGNLPLVKNCYANCNIYGIKGNYMYIGGFFGDAACYAYNCYVAGTVDGYRTVGGFAGFQEVLDTSFTNCVSACRVVAEPVHDYLEAGGFIGNNQYGVSLHNCFWVQTDEINSDYQESELYGYAIRENGSILSPENFGYSNAQDVLNSWVFQNSHDSSSIWLLRSGEILLSEIHAVISENGYSLSVQERNTCPFVLATFDAAGKMRSASIFYQSEVRLPDRFDTSNLYQLFWIDCDFVPLQAAASF